jgi:hypothetical protein
MMAMDLMKNLPHLTLKMILDQLSFEDIINLRRTPVWRGVVFQFYKVEMNLSDLIRLGLLEIFDEFIDLCPNFVELNYDYFYSKGMMDIVKSDRYLNAKRKFFSLIYDEEIQFVEPLTFKEIGNRKFREYLLEKNYSLYTICDIVVENMDKVNYQSKGVEKHRRFRALSNFLDCAERELDRALDLHLADFLESFFYHPRHGLKNVLDVFERIGLMNDSKLYKQYSETKPLQKLDLIEKIFVNHQ